MRHQLTPGELAEAAWATVRARRVVAALLVAASVAGALAYSELAREQEARVLVALNPANAVQAVFNEPRRFTPGPSGADFRQDRVLKEVAVRAGIPLAELRERTAIIQDGDERNVVLAVRAQDGARASEIAQVWTEEIIADRRRALRGQIQRAAREVRARARRLNRETTVITRRDVLRAILAIEAATVTPPEVRQVGPPETRATTLSPPLAVAAGLALAAAMLLLVAALDGRIRTPAVAAVVGRAPVVRVGRGEGLEAVVAALHVRRGPGAPSSVLVTGLAPAVSAAWAAGLGDELAGAGRTVAVLSIGSTVDGGTPVTSLDELRLHAAERSVDGGAARFDARQVVAGPDAWSAFLQDEREAVDVIVVAADDLASAASAAAARLPDAPHIAVAVAGQTARRALRAAAGEAGRPLTLVVLGDEASPARSAPPVGGGAPVLV